MAFLSQLLLLSIDLNAALSLVYTETINPDHAFRCPTSGSVLLAHGLRSDTW